MNARRKRSRGGGGSPTAASGRARGVQPLRVLARRLGAARVAPRQQRAVARVHGERRRLRARQRAEVEEEPVVAAVARLRAHVAREDRLVGERRARVRRVLRGGREVRAPAQRALREDDLGVGPKEDALAARAVAERAHPAAGGGELVHVEPEGREPLREVRRRRAAGAQHR